MYLDILKYEDQPRDNAGRFATSWNKVSGKLGSTDGGVFYKGNEKHYAKFPSDADQVHTEVASDKVYALMGCNVLHHEATEIQGRLASTTKWEDDLKPIGYHGWLTLDHKQKQQAANIFMASALTKNWDLVGLSYDNIAKTSMGDLCIVDTGGSFTFRAMGGAKEFDGDATQEVKSFLNPDRGAGRVFFPLVKHHPELFKEAASRLKQLHLADFETALKGSPLKDKQVILDTLMKRRDSLLSMFKP